MSPKAALVTGGAGFVGASLVRRLLADGHRVELLVRPGSDRWRLADVDNELVIREVDLRDGQSVDVAVSSARPDWIFHLAAHGAYSWQTDARGSIESNLMGTLVLTQSCMARGFESFVHAGSSSEYGRKSEAPDEDTLPEPNSFYAVGKLAATQLCRYLANDRDFCFTTLRLYSVYGPWEDPRRLLPTLVSHGLRQQLPPLVDPQTARDFVHVDDVCDAFMRVARARARPVSPIYNVGSGRQVPLESLVDIVRRALNVTEEPRWRSHDQRPWDTDVWVSDPSRIRRELGWQARRDLASGVLGLAEWITSRADIAERYGAPY